MPSPTVLRYSNSKIGGLALIQGKSSGFLPTRCTQPLYKQGCIWKILNKDYPLKKDKRIGLQGPVNDDHGGASLCRRDIKPYANFPLTQDWQILHIPGYQAWEHEQAWRSFILLMWFSLLLQMEKNEGWSCREWTRRIVPFWIELQSPSLSIVFSDGMRIGNELKYTWPTLQDILMGSVNHRAER